VIGLLALLFFGIPMMLIALAIRLDSPGPVFFRQPREGFNNEQFVVWKFRTMRHETADMKAERQVTANDDRVTRVGRILRKTSLDGWRPVVGTGCTIRAPSPNQARYYGLGCH